MCSTVNREVSFTQLRHIFTNIMLIKNAQEAVILFHMKKETEVIIFLCTVGHG